jgi:hypothetical protein
MMRWWSSSDLPDSGCAVLLVLADISNARLSPQ